jgi:hypothetical protein
MSVVKNGLSVWANISTPSFCLLIAKRNSGKSHMIKHILYTLAKNNKFDFCLVVTATKFTGEYGAIVGERNVFDTFSMEWFNALLNAQQTSIKRNKSCRCLLILDDVLGSLGMQSPTLTKIAIAGRHYQLTVMLASQQLTKTPTVFRTNADYVFLLGPFPQGHTKIIFEEFNPEGIENHKDLHEYITEGTADHGAILIDNSTARTTIKQVRAPANPPRFKLTHKK